MPTKTEPAYRALIAGIACDFDPSFEFDARDLPLLTDSQLAVVVNHEECVALDSFTPSYYAEILDSAVYLTEEAKALAYWREMGRAVRESAKGVLAESINEHLAQWRTPEPFAHPSRAEA